MHLDVFIQLWDRVRGSLWFIPALLAIGAIILSIATPWLDRLIGADVATDAVLLFSGQPVGARAVLTTIAGGMITITGVVFSMTLVSLQLASSQFGPRLLRTFLRDRVNQTTLGIFIGVFLYCVLVLPGVDAAPDATFVPRIAVTVAIVLAVIGLGALVYFIDHVAQSIHADAVIASVGRELTDAIDTLCPESDDNRCADRDAQAWRPSTDTPRTDVAAEREGYVRFIETERIVAVARTHDVVVEAVIAPGAFVMRGQTLAAIHGRPDEDDDATEMMSIVRRAFVLDAHRTVLQDLSFAFEQLMEMAVRALSPGINDPGTALRCLDRMGAGLVRLVEHPFPSPLRVDADDAVRCVLPALRLGPLVRTAFDPVARCAHPHVGVTIRLLALLEIARARTNDPDHVAALEDFAAGVVGAAKRRYEDEHDRESVTAAARWLTARASG